MKAIVISFFLIAIVCPPGSEAHETGISRAEIVESVVNSYVLRVKLSASEADTFTAPSIPAQCRYSSIPGGVRKSTWKVFEFHCLGGLGPDDIIVLDWQRDGILLSASWIDGSSSSRLFRENVGEIRVPLTELLIPSSSLSIAASRYALLGFQHILEGIDHLLFVLALLLIVQNGWMLVKTITAFTIAHSLTLALATLGFVNAPTRPIEAAIALSIAFLAAEIINAQRGRVGLTYHAPWLIAFIFGLLHGFGFAGALSDIGLPPAEIPIALLFFNLGVEAGQLSFVVAVVALVWLGSRMKNPLTDWARAAPAYTIGTFAMFWFFERVLL